MGYMVHMVYVTIIGLFIILALFAVVHAQKSINDCYIPLRQEVLVVEKNNTSIEYCIDMIREVQQIEGLFEDESKHLNNSS